MFMRWEDLEPGDVVKFTDKVIDYYESSFFGWVISIKNKFFKIRYIEIMNSYDVGYISLYLDGYHNIINLKFDGEAYTGFSDFSGPILEIVSLKE